jgi:uncharacterized oxidoreductase
MKIKGNTILITGGATGIGLSLAARFLHLENTVIICGRRAEKLAEARLKFHTLNTYLCDLSNLEERTDFSAWLIQNFPELNVLINNAGVQFETDLTDATKIDQVLLETNTNFIAPIHLSALLIPHLKTKTDAAILNVSSGLAFSPIAVMPVYCASKAALHSYSLSLRHQLKGTAIKVYEIAPPMVDTELDRGALTKRGLTHKGMPVEVCTDLIMKAIENDTYEAALGDAENMRIKRDGLFPFMNP